MTKKVPEISNHFFCRFKIFSLCRIPLGIFNDWCKTTMVLILSKGIIKNIYDSIIMYMATEVNMNKAQFKSFEIKTGVMDN